MEPNVSTVLVLLSGGQDSTTCLFWAKNRYPTAAVHALTMFYGQRHDAELAAAVEIADLAGCASHRIVDLSGALNRSDSALLAANADKTLRGDGGIPDQAMPDGLPTSFVPGRNLVFLAVAGAHAAALGAQVIVTGVCQTDYSGYPDCRKSFIDAMQAAINEAIPSSLRDISVRAPLMFMTKEETVALADSLSLGDRTSAVWTALGRSITCYHGKRPGCGACPACELRAKGFRAAGMPDPSERPEVLP